MPTFHPLRTDRRGQSEVLGFVMLIGVVVVAVGLLAMYGNAAASTNQDRIAVEQATSGLEQFDTRASRVAFDESEVQRLDVGVTGTRGSLDTRPDDGCISVEIVNASDPNDVTPVVDKQRLGAVTYTLDDATVAYQGGGVWRKDGDGAVMLSRPEFHFEDGTLTLPIVVTGGDGAVYSDVVIRPDGDVEQKYPDASRNLTNKVEYEKVRVTIQSDYYEAWGRYLEVETGGYVVDYDHDADTVTVVFDGLGTGFGRHGGIIATSGSAEVDLTGNGFKIDSYDSSTGTYDKTVGSNGLLVAVNDIDVGGSADIDGDISAGNDVKVSGNPSITGAVHYNGTYTNNDGKFDGETRTTQGVETIEPIDDYVHTTVANAKAANDNAAAQADGVMVGNQLQGSGTLDAGVYYFDDLTVGRGETLTLNTTGGDIVIAVEGRVSIGGDTSGQPSKIEVVGPGTVEVVVNGTGLKNNEEHFWMGPDTSVDVPDENAGQFRVYGSQEFQATLTGSSGNGNGGNGGGNGGNGVGGGNGGGNQDADAEQNLRFEGAIYAPAGLTGDGSITIGQAEIFGILVTGELNVGQYASIHYDENLANGWFPGDPFSSNLEYLHVSVHRIEVTER